MVWGWRQLPAQCACVVTHLGHACSRRWGRTCRSRQITAHALWLTSAMMEEMREDLLEPTDHCACVVAQIGHDGGDEGGLARADRSLRIRGDSPRPGWKRWGRTWRSQEITAHASWWLTSAMMEEMREDLPEPTDPATPTSCPRRA